MKFRYIGEEHPTVFGLDWHNGIVHDVTDPHAVKKLSGNCFFEKADTKAEVQSAPVVASPAALEAALETHEQVAVPQLPRRRGPNKPKPEAP